MSSSTTQNPAAAAGNTSSADVTATTGTAASSAATTRAKMDKNLNETIQQRLLTGVVSKGGSRGSLTRVATKYGTFWSKLQELGREKEKQKKEKNETEEKQRQNLEQLQRECRETKEDLKRELLLFQIEMNKWILMIESNKKEALLKQRHIDGRNIPQSTLAIKELRQKARKSCRVRQCWEEYERLAELARKRSPRRITKDKIKLVAKELEETQKKLYETEFVSQLREKQFQLLIQCMLDLKHSFKEEVIIPKQQQQQQQQQQTQSPNRNTAENKKDDNAANAATAATAATSSDPTPMEEDNSNGNGNEDDGLYSDL